MTTLATLTRVEAALGALAEALSDDEVLCLDRVDILRYVLNYLRDPFAKPRSPRPDRPASSRERRFLWSPQDRQPPFYKWLGRRVGVYQVVRKLVRDELRSNMNIDKLVGPRLTTLL